MLTYNFSIWKSHYSRNHYLFTIISGSQLKSPVIKVPSIMNIHLRGNFILAKTTLEILFWQKIYVTLFFTSLLNLQCLESSAFYVLKCSVKQMLWAVETSWRSHGEVGKTTSSLFPLPVWCATTGKWLESSDLHFPL